MCAIDCEVLVVGGGPSGALIASNLARSGVEVIQVVAAHTQRDRPYEVLGPSTRRLLAQHGLAEPVHGSSDCRGLLSRWERSDLEFHDYALTSCLPALTVDRSAFHDTLISSARVAGALVLQPAKVKNVQELWLSHWTVEVLSKQQTILITAKWIIDATGRQGSPCIPEQIQRDYFDNLFAMSTPFEATNYQDCLLVEAVPEGWWYVSPSIDARRQLVFLTDIDLMPPGRIARAEWLSHCFTNSKLVSDIATDVPSFHYLKGTDARFSRMSSVVYGHWVAAGDAALALDPLSGTGTWTALTGAAQLAAEFCAHREISTTYTNWCHQAFKRERKVRWEVYSQAYPRFPEATFWQRRQNISRGSLYPADEE